MKETPKDVSESKQREREREREKKKDDEKMSEYEVIKTNRYTLSFQHNADVVFYIFLLIKTPS
jgi:hypothetical protein